MSLLGLAADSLHTVEVDVPTCRAIARADMPVGSGSSICCCYAGRARLRSHLTRNEALAEGEQGLPVVRVELASAPGTKTILYIQTTS